MSFGLGTLGAGLASAAVEGLPWPEGDADGLADVARQVSAAVELTRANAGRLDAAGATAAGWQGEAAAAFQSAISRESQGMRAAAGDLATAGGALKKLSGIVEEAQQTVVALAREVHEAEEAARQAAARAAIAQATAAATAGMVGLSPDGASPALEARADNAAADAASAGRGAAAAQAHAEEVRARNTRLAQEACDEVEREDAATATAVNLAASAAPLGGTYGALGLTPAQSYGRSAFTNLTREQWLQLAYARAGIDGESWDPSQGLLANDDTVQKVYAYYGELWSDHNELQWAGMANVVGPMFYAGWQDIYTIRHVTDPGDRIDYLEKLTGAPDLPSWADEAIGHLPLGPADIPQHLTANELEGFEDRFLTMQKEIFDDLAWQHEAYLWGGVGALSHVAATQPDAIDQRALSAWEDIDSGDPELVDYGNEQLLLREQSQVIQDNYDAMRDHHGPVGEGFTYMTTIMAENPFEGGEAYRDFDPLVVEIDPTPTIPFTGWDPPGPEAHLTTPLPAGNIAGFNDRWAWISEDMLPNYEALAHDPDRLQEIIDLPVSERAEAMRKLGILPYPGG